MCRKLPKPKDAYGLAGHVTPHVTRLEADMDNDLLDLANRLCTVAGMTMEDSSLIAVSSPKSPQERRRQIENVALAGDDIKALMAAAKVLVRLG